MSPEGDKLVVADTYTDPRDPDAESGSMVTLKTRIKAHYDVCSTYYQSLWGEHVHHGYFLTPQDSKEQAQIQLIDLLYDQSQTCVGVPTPVSATENSNSTIGGVDENRTLNGNVRVLDTGCGLGGTSRYLARKHGWHVTGITLSDVQVKMAYQLSGASLDSNASTTTGATTTTTKEATRTATTTDLHDLDSNHPKFEENGNLTHSNPKPKPSPNPNPTIALDKGSVTYLQQDAETLYPHFPSASFEIVWISEALSHLPNKPLFFSNAYKVLTPASSTTSYSSSTTATPRTGRLVIADWVKASNLTQEELENDILPIEKGMLLPPLASSEEYCEMAKQVGFRLVNQMDISDKVSKTWDISLGLITNPSLWAFALSQGSDFISFLKSFQAMRRGFANGTFRYTVLVFEKV